MEKIGEIEIDDIHVGKNFRRDFNDAPEKQTTDAPKKEALKEGQVSIVVEEKEVVFQVGQTDLPGMPEMSHLRKMAGAWVKKAGDIAIEEDLQDKLTQEIMLQLRSEGRTGFAYREGGSTYIFAINAPEEKLVVKRKKQ